MSIALEIDATTRVVTATATGVLSADDLVALRDLIRDHEDFNRELGSIFDLRETTSIAFGGSMVQLLVSSSPFAPTSPRALVASKPFQVGMARMYQLHGESAGISVAVFASLDAASTWVQQRLARNEAGSRRTEFTEGG